MNEPSMLQVVLMGVITVFVVLVFLIGIIKLLGLVMAAITGKKDSAPVPAPAAASAPQAGSAQPNKQQLVAAIAVAIAEDMGSTVNHIKIHSIRRL